MRSSAARRCSSPGAEPPAPPGQRGIPRGGRARGSVTQRSPETASRASATKNPNDRRVGEGSGEIKVPEQHAPAERGSGQRPARSGAQRSARQRDGAPLAAGPPGAEGHREHPHGCSGLRRAAGHTASFRQEPRLRETSEFPHRPGTALPGRFCPAGKRARSSRPPQPRAQPAPLLSPQPPVPLPAAMVTARKPEPTRRAPTPPAPLGHSRRGVRRSPPAAPPAAPQPAARRGRYRRRPPSAACRPAISSRKCPGSRRPSGWRWHLP